MTNAAQNRRYDTTDSEFIHTFGGLSELLSSDDANKVVDSNMDTDTPLLSCTNFKEVAVDDKAPWYNAEANTNQGVAVFAGPQNSGDVTVFTYKLNFNHLATILNIKVQGA